MRDWALIAQSTSFIIIGALLSEGDVKSQPAYRADLEVSWEARHFGLLQRLTVRFNEYDQSRRFSDWMVRRACPSLCRRVAVL
jgi:hypothetical protein